MCGVILRNGRDCNAAVGEDAPFNICPEHLRLAVAWQRRQPVKSTTYVDVVYYLRFGDRIKIGTSANLRQRLAVLPHDELLAIELGDRAKENSRHVQFDSFRFGKTEWFRPDDVLVRHIRKLRAGVSDPWEQLAFYERRSRAEVQESTTIAS